MMDLQACLTWLLCAVLVSRTAGDHGNSLLPTQTCELAEGLVYVVTVDGGVTVINEHGQIRWQYHTGSPLFQSTINHKGKDLSQLIVPALDRSLYSWAGDKLNQLPFTANHLVDNPHFQKRRGTFLTGSKTNNVVGINLHNGQAVYECSPQRCHRYDNQSMISCMDILMLSLSRVTVREANDRTGEELWNFTVGGVQLSLVAEEDGEEWEDMHSCGTWDVYWDLHVRTVEGVVYATDRSASRQSLWEIQLSSPVVSVWLHVGGKLELLNLPPHPRSTELPSCGDSAPSSVGSFLGPPPGFMMVPFKEQLYLQPLGAWPVAIATNINTASSEPTQLVQQYNLVLPDRLGAALTDEGTRDMEDGASGTTDLTLFYNNDLFQDLSTSGPQGEAIYFLMDSQPCPAEDGNTSNESLCSVESGRFTCPATTPTFPGWLYSVLKYVLFAVAVLAVNRLRRIISQHRRRRNSSTSSSTDGQCDDLPDLPPLSLNTNRQISTATTESAATLTPFTPTFSNGSAPQFVTQNSQRDTEPQLCRFDSEYEFKGCLGKGGFGVVYHVRNKTDGGEYALKRIKLPPQKAARDKVMREVRALAQLDHPRIVRYYNSWVEKLPQGWKDANIDISRRSSLSIVQDSVLSAVVTATGSCSSSSENGPPTFLVPTASSCSSHSQPVHLHRAAQSQAISPCPSFNSLNHSNIHAILPPLSTDSRSSSFVIEFKEECTNSCDQLKACATDGKRSPLLDMDRRSASRPESRRSEITASHVQGESTSCEGCFRHALMDRQNSLSSEGSQSTEDKDERRDSVADLAVESPSFLFIQMQLCQKESLKDWLRTNIANRCRPEVMHFFDQILDAVLYVHEKDMMHRDLKPSNIFFSLDGQVKVGDFGLVTSSTYGALQNSYVTLKALGEEQQGAGHQHTGNLGSHFYMSPELILGKKYNKKVDIFSLGIILFELHYPFSTNMERAKVLEDVRNSNFPPKFESSLPVEAELVKWLTARHPTERPFVTDICSSQHFKKLRTGTGTIPKL